jgi:hypothetical protein
MIKKLVLAAPCLAMLAACGGGSTGAVSFQTLNASAPYTFSLDEISSIDFSASEVGSSVVISGGDLDGLSITKLSDIAGKQSFAVGIGPGETGRTVLVQGNISQVLNAYERVQSVSGPEETIPEAGNLSYWKRYRSIGSTETNERELIVSTSVDEQTKGVFTWGESDGNEFLEFGYAQEDMSNDFSIVLVGEYSYTGQVMVLEDHGGYTDEAGTVLLNFTNKQGSFTAENFTANDGGNLTGITVNANLNFDPVSGEITSSDGNLRTATSTSTESNVSIIGAISSDNTGVAGAIITTEPVDGLVGGVFAHQIDPS